jgi:hypothetical protein
MELR